MFNKISSHLIRHAAISTMVCGLALLAGCERTKESARAVDSTEFSPIFQTQIMRVLQSGSKVNALASEGTDLNEFASAFKEMKGEAELGLVMWPESFSSKAKNDVIETISAWSFTCELWAKKNVFFAENYNKPNYNGPLYTYGAVDIMEKYNQMSEKFKSQIPIEEAFEDQDKAPCIRFDKIPKCIGIGSSSFEAARSEILAEFR
jgi:hypothetical protein